MVNLGEDNFLAEPGPTSKVNITILERFYVTHIYNFIGVYRSILKVLRKIQLTVLSFYYLKDLFTFYILSVYGWTYGWIGMYDI